MATTLDRVGTGFALGVAAGTVLGAISGYWQLTRRLLDRAFHLSRPAMTRRILLPAVLPMSGPEHSQGKRRLVESASRGFDPDPPTPDRAA